MPIVEQLLLSVRDLQYVSIECPSCKTEITFDVVAASADGAPHTEVPQVCPACGSDFDRDLRPGLSRLFGALALLRRLQLGNVGFRIEFPRK